MRISLHFKLIYYINDFIYETVSAFPWSLSDPARSCPHPDLRSRPRGSCDAPSRCAIHQSLCTGRRHKSFPASEPGRYSHRQFHALRFRRSLRNLRGHCRQPIAISRNPRRRHQHRAARRPDRHVCPDRLRAVRLDFVLARCRRVCARGQGNQLPELPLWRSRLRHRFRPARSRGLGHQLLCAHASALARRPWNARRDCRRTLLA